MMRHCLRNVRRSGHVVRRTYYSSAECDLNEFSELLRTSQAEPAELRFASEVVHGGIGIYDAKVLQADAVSGADCRLLEIELARLMLEGSGIAVFRRAFDPGLVDAVTQAFNRLIVSASSPSGDHFAKPGANDRVWNALEKLATTEPSLFVQYYCNETLAMASRAWLGPNYQVTSQVNVVKPGGDAQEPHRDYHLGFATDALAARFPAHAHSMTPLLTLQGAVAHSDMPLASGPTTYLPHSHKYKPGYVAFRRDDFKLFYAEHKVLERTQAHNTHAYTRTRGFECEARRTYPCAADACCRG
jgi:ectoine hydroxylase-related dioxygenase (phytanoyl-CoA dioxygenase family)